MPDDDTVPVLFSLDELWTLQAVVRHEVSQQRENWKWPPASLSLNDRIAEGISTMTEHNLTDYYLSLSRGDCLVIDYTVKADMKDANGRPVGKPILIKSFNTRRYLAYGNDGGGAAEPQGQPTVTQVRERLAALKDDENGKPR